MPAAAPRALVVLGAYLLAQALIGLRNIISHGDEVIDQEEIWQIVTEEQLAFAATVDAVDVPEDHS